MNRRLTEQQWLEDQLRNTPTETTFQGLRDVRTFVGIYNKTSAAFDPLAGQVDTAQGELTLQHLQNQRSLTATQHQLDTLKLQQQIEALQKAGTTQNVGSTATGTTSPVAAAAAVPQRQQVAAPNSTPTASGVFSSPPALPSGADAQTTRARLTSIEVLRDQLAWRNAVQAALREQELDDAHDLAGMALYTLKFDLTVLSNGVADGYAKVEFDLAPRKEMVEAGSVEAGRPEQEKAGRCREVRAAYYSWFWHFRRDLRIEAVALQQRIEQDLLSDEERVRLAATSAAEAVRVGSDEKAPEAATERVMKALAALLSQPAAERRTKDFLQEAKQGAAKWVEAKYAVSLPRGLVIFEKEPLPIDLDGRRYYVPKIPNPTLPPENCSDIQTSEVLRVFAALEERITKSPTVFVADPKEQAQNISEVAAIEQLRNMVLSLQATLPQYGLTAANYTEYLRRSQERLQAITRRPLVVAYSGDGSRFGWILGPRFEIGKGGKPEFRHTAAQHSVQVSIVAPAWKRNLRLGYTTSWIGQGGAPGTKRPGHIDLMLPGDDRAITTAMLAETGTTRAPMIEAQTIGQRERQTLRVQAGKPADILIRGQNLWRNPRVFLGGQPADLVSVLPDMNGLSAHFKGVIMPPRRAKEIPLVDLVVVTSEGTDTLRRGVQVFPDGVVPQGKFALTVESRLVIDVSSDKTFPLALSAPFDAMRDGFSQLVARVRPLLPGEDGSKVDRPYLDLPGPVQLAQEGDKAVFRVPAELPGFAQWPGIWRAILDGKNDSLSGGLLMQAELAMAPTPGAPIEAIPSADGKPMTFAYFTHRRSSQGTLSVKGAPASEPKTAFGPGNNFAQAIAVSLGGDDIFASVYPGLTSALQSGLTLRIAEVVANSEIAHTTTRLVQEQDFQVDSILPGGKPLPPEGGTPLERLLARLTMTINSLPGTDRKDPRTAAVKWLKERLGDGREHEFRFSIVISSAVRVPIEPLVKITGRK